MQSAVLFVQRFAQPVQVGVIVLFGKEAGLAVVTALHDVQRDSINVDAGAAGHAGNCTSCLMENRAWLIFPLKPVP
jgi:hypothetical protein